MSVFVFESKTNDDNSEFWFWPKWYSQKIHDWDRVICLFWTSQFRRSFFPLHLWKNHLFFNRFNEDCQYQHCGYREHQTHFHCQRQDCGYSFCDKTRFVQHTARHERLDTLMGGDFQQYRANVACGRTDCAYTTNLGKWQIFFWQLVQWSSKLLERLVS